MKFLVIFSVALACVAASSVPNSADALAPVVRSSYDITPEGAYQYVYETGNGIYGQAAGALKNLKGEYPTLEVTGANKYTSPEGIPIETTYVANENGYQPQGNHLPVGPPIPEAIARSLAYIAAHPAQPEKLNTYVQG